MSKPQTLADAADQLNMAKHRLVVMVLEWLTREITRLKITWRTK